MQPTLTYGPIEIWRAMGPMGHLVLIGLLTMSVYSMAIAVDRWLLFRRAQSESRRFVETARSLLAQGRLADVLAEAGRHPHSHVARIYRAALGEGRSGDPAEIFRAPGDSAEVFRGPGGMDSRESIAQAARGAAEREAVVIGQEFQRGLPVLASIGSTAPFVGLFGTVIGIMNSFFGMAAAGSGGIVAVAGGIAEALVNTAAGILVALPAVWAFNHFLGRLELVRSEMGNAGSELADNLSHHGRSETWTSEAPARRAAGC